ncbi:MAG: hypothetical protein GXP49_08360 [Deltaproteobacteria bacterium]|nr:hypothetical protein [Deltaproteobacteria bacterium]
MERLIRERFQQQAYNAVLILSCMTLAFSLAACTPTQVKKSKCPEDARLVGTGPPQGIEKGCIRLKRNGKAERHGTWRTWYDDGSPRTAGEYRWGNRCGIWKTWEKDDSKPKEKDFGPCPVYKPCKQDLDCEPPFTRCDESRGYCVDGCYQIPCDKGFVCSLETGECVRAVNGIKIEPPNAH